MIITITKIVLVTVFMTKNLNSTRLNYPRINDGLRLRLLWR